MNTATLPAANADSSRASLQRRIWRWHFLAGVMVIPFAILLASSGAVYLFKPQFEAWQDARLQQPLPAASATASALPAEVLLARALEVVPESRLIKFTLPRSSSDRSWEFELASPQGKTTLWLEQYSGDVLHQAASDWRLMAAAKTLHGHFFAGEAGAWWVELMASWMIVLLASGLYLWWPRKQVWWRMFLPQLGGGLRPRELWRRLHGAVGAWASAFILLLLVSGLPWTSVWGAGFDWVQSRMGWDGPGQEWFVTLQSQPPGAHAEHGDGLDLWERGSGEESTVSLESAPVAVGVAPLPLQQIVERVIPQQLPPPVEIRPPRGENGVWTVRSMVANRPLRQTVHYDRWSGDEIMRIRFADYHPVQQVVSYGIALHEGALFGWLNQLLGLLTALAVIGLAVSGTVVWWRRRPVGALGVPPLPKNLRLGRGVQVLILVLALTLPLLGLSLLVLWLGETLWQLLARLRPAANALSTE